MSSSAASSDNKSGTKTTVPTHEKIFGGDSFEALTKTKDETKFKKFLDTVKKIVNADDLATVITNFKKSDKLPEAYRQQQKEVKMGTTPEEIANTRAAIARIYFEFFKGLLLASKKGKKGNESLTVEKPLLEKIAKALQEKIPQDSRPQKGGDNKNTLAKYCVLLFALHLGVPAQDIQWPAFMNEAPKTEPAAPPAAAAAAASSAAPVDGTKASKKRKSTTDEDESTITKDQVIAKQAEIIKHYAGYVNGIDFALKASGQKVQFDPTVLQDVVKKGKELQEELRTLQESQQPPAKKTKL